MKLKQNPNDFIVEEVCDIELTKEENKFKVFLLEKTGIDSFYLISKISSLNNIPVKQIGVAGLKDRHAITKQYLTIPKEYSIKQIKEANIRFLGYSKNPLALGDLKKNRFIITARDLSKQDVSAIPRRVEDLLKYGAPNYFDSQRFGSVIENEFIAKHLIKKDYENAVKIFLTKYTKSEPKRIKDDKRNILFNWNNLENITVIDKQLKMLVDEYKKTRNFLSVFKKIPENLKEMFVSAFQSYLWNECIKNLLKKSCKEKHLYLIKYNIDELVYFKNIDENEFKSLPKTFKTLSDKISLSDFEKGIAEKILKKEGISLPELNIKKETGNFFKSHERNILLFPEEFSISEFSEDELNKNRFKVTLSFTLEKGSYATIITKKIFKQ